MNDVASKDRRKDTLLRMRTVTLRTGLSRATIYRKEAAGTFPRRQQLSAHMIAWYESDVEDYIAAPVDYRAP